MINYLKAKEKIISLIIKWLFYMEALNKEWLNYNKLIKNNIYY
ncbi:hypothetical protein CNEO2_450021 [Clostridium neonatale]|nr:hypothetical protein CNEO2_260020 [Clostridium neonatale]CAI3203898.1 hypothetical protein CNEO2_290020 [Clostridium neonatale]CAI3236986.1 hypothetical protein CNEO2_240020 [Clostridium neonatale]CAI3242013.1 hypothetical protein CNEO2_450021 [Clostridium neonatale]CAI3546874.1 hypothetical protein CNEO4_230020 [Clostridium neonatale]